MPDLERYETFNPGFSSPAHDLYPITTREEFAQEQLKKSLAQAAFWLGAAHSWAAEVGLDGEFSTDLADAIHYTGMCQLRVIEE